MDHPPIHLWGIDAPLEPMAGGHRNAVWCTRGLDQDLVFKASQRSESALSWLAEVQTIARATGLHVPQMHRSLSGHWRADGWTCENFVQGEPVSPSEAHDLAAPLTRFHKQTRERSQRPGFLSTAELLTKEAGGDVDLTTMPDDLVALCRAAWAAVQNEPHCVVHGDIAKGNLLRAPDGCLWLIDWDECRRDLPLFDRVAMSEVEPVEYRAHLAWEVACCWQREPDRARALAQKLRNAWR